MSGQGATAEWARRQQAFLRAWVAYGPVPCPRCARPFWPRWDHCTQAGTTAKLRCPRCWTFIVWGPLRARPTPAPPASAPARWWQFWRW